MVATQLLRNTLDPICRMYMVATQLLRNTLDPICRMYMVATQLLRNTMHPMHHVHMMVTMRTRFRLLRMKATACDPIAILPAVGLFIVPKA